MDKVEEYFFSNIEKMNEEIKRFNKEMGELFEKDVTVMSSVIKCHLIIENFIDRYLERSYPTIESWESIRLSFNQKLEIINYSRSALKFWYPGIKELNSLRNKYAHDINYPLKEQDYSKMKGTVEEFYKKTGEPTKPGIGIIPAFTQLACAFLDAAINGIESHGGSFGLPGYLDWYRKTFSNQP